MSKMGFKSMLAIAGLLLTFNLWADELPPITIHVETPGTLSTLIAENRKYEITDLTLTGNLNDGTDLVFLREMAGYNSNGKLANLNIADVNIYNYSYGNTFPVTILPSFSLYPKLTKIITPNSITTIGNGAFDHCANLQSVILGNKVTSIGASAFRGCMELTDITLPNTLASIGWGAFEWCSSMKNISLPDNITNIDGRAFWYCLSLTSIVIPNRVTKISDGLFSDCSNLTSVSIGNQVTSIGDNAFVKCKSITNFIIPESVTSIDHDAFSGCTSLTNITIPNSVTSIGYNAFWGCSGLTSITILNGVTSIGSRAFSGCTGLTTITIPESVTSMEGAFLGCSSLTTFVVLEQNNSYSVMDGVLYNKSQTQLIAYPPAKPNNNYTIPGTVTEISGYAFTECANLTSIMIPDNVVSIGYGAFGGCIGLKDVSIGNGVTTIEYGAFSGCTSLTNLIIGKNVTSIGDYAFSGCANLTEIHSHNPIPAKIAAGCFSNVDKTSCKLYVPKGSYTAYWLAWGFDNVIEEEEMAIQPVNPGMPIIKPVMKGIVVETSESIPVAIYTVSGQKLYQSLINKHTEIQLIPGIYMVRINDEVRKVIVQ